MPRSLQYCHAKNAPELRIFLLAANGARFGLPFEESSPQLNQPRKLAQTKSGGDGLELGAGVTAPDIPARAPRPAPPPPPKMSQDKVRALRRKKLAATKGLGAELARRLDVAPPQISRFKAGTEDFPVAKLDALWALLKE